MTPRNYDINDFIKNIDIKADSNIHIHMLEKHYFIAVRMD
jgi:hypothetical protein